MQHLAGRLSRVLGLALAVTPARVAQILFQVSIHVQDLDLKTMLAAQPRLAGNAAIKSYEWDSSDACWHSVGRGCLVEKCVGLPGVFPDVYWTETPQEIKEKKGPDSAWKSQTSSSQTSATTRNIRKKLPRRPNNQKPWDFWMCMILNQRRRDDNENKNFAFWGGGGLGGQRGKSSKTLSFVGNATTIKFWKCNFIVEKFSCHCAGSY